MRKAKVGDWISRNNWNNKYWEVVRVEGRSLYLDYYGRHMEYPIENEWVFKDTDSIHMPLYSTEQAVKWLEKEGFTVTPPPEPMKGKIYIYKSSDKTGWYPTYGRQYHDELIAIVDWTEGNGL